VNQANEVGNGLEEIIVAPDVVYGRKLGMALTMDLYRPSRRSGAAVLFMNSGGFESGKLTQYEMSDGGRPRALGAHELGLEECPEPIPLLAQFSFAPLLANGFTVFDVRHGSSPRFTLGEIVDDVRTALRFVADEAQRFGVDPLRIGVWGASAGGYLAIALGAAGADDSRRGQRPHHIGARVAAVAAYYAAGYDFLADADRFPEVIAQVPALKIDRAALDELSLKGRIGAASPPTLIVYGTDDAPFITETCVNVDRDLVEAGAVSRLVALEGTGHEFSGQDGFHPQHAQRATEEMVSWFERYLI